jgi:5-methyltetrahydropteroyltriglutamate--homocysteine methyltransferase
LTTKTPRAETEDELEARILSAAELVDLERLAVGTQCGFSTSVVGNRISVDDERHKLETIARTAERVWGRGK